MMKFGKKLLVAALAVLMLTLCACGSSAKGNTTYSGTVTALSLTSVTLKTDDGEVTISLKEDTVFTADLSDFEFGDMGDMEVPDEGFGQLPDGEMGQLPDGDMGELSDGEIGQLPEGDMGGGMMDPGGMGGQGGMMPGGDMEQIGGMTFSVYDLSLGDTLTIETDGDGKADTITIAAMGGLLGRVGN